jgi:hypothetical protein
MEGSRQRKRHQLETGTKHSQTAHQVKHAIMTKTAALKQLFQKAPAPQISPLMSLVDLNFV